MRKKFSAFLSAHYQLIGVVIGSFLVLVSTGTYTNWDAQTEFEAASSVVTRGFPLVSSGFMINQPPLGFYMDAPFFHAFGLSYINGVGVIAGFGLGCVALVYALGCVLYGRKSGLVAAAIFGIVPWQVFMSRIFLIDAQCMFFSLLYLVVGILAVRRNSEKLLFASGIVFAVALMTKLFAVFMLVPLLLIIYLQRNEGGFKLTLRKVLVFLVPSFVLQGIWFGGFANQNFLGVYFNTDFTHTVLVANPSLVFLPTLFVESAGWFLFIAVLFSLALSLFYRKVFARTLWLDAVCVGTIAVVSALDMLFVFGFHLTVPYISAFKYNYLALPFFCLLAASLVKKGNLLVGSMEPKKRLQKLKLIPVAFGMFLLFACMVESLVFLYRHPGFTAFEVDSRGNYYPFFPFSSPWDSSQAFHYAAIVLILFSFVLPFVLSFLKRKVGWLVMVLSS